MPGLCRDIFGIYIPVCKLTLHTANTYIYSSSKWSGSFHYWLNTYIYIVNRYHSSLLLSLTSRLCLYIPVTVYIPWVKPTCRVRPALPSCKYKPREKSKLSSLRQAVSFENESTPWENEALIFWYHSIHTHVQVAQKISVIIPDDEVTPPGTAAALDAPGMVAQSQHSIMGSILEGLRGPSRLFASNNAGSKVSKLNTWCVQLTHTVHT